MSGWGEEPANVEESQPSQRENNDGTQRPGPSWPEEGGFQRPKRGKTTKQPLENLSYQLPPPLDLTPVIGKSYTVKVHSLNDERKYACVGFNPQDFRGSVTKEGRLYLYQIRKEKSAKKVSDVLNVGDELRVKVTKIEPKYIVVSGQDAEPDNSHKTPAQEEQSERNWGGEGGNCADDVDEDVAREYLEQGGWGTENTQAWDQAW